MALTTEAYAAELLGADPSSGALPKQDAAYLSQRAAAMLDATRKDLQQAGEQDGIFIQGVGRRQELGER